MIRTVFLTQAALFLLLAIPGALAGGKLATSCCSELEERVQELEMTTVRKGNRKVSFRLSGQVNRMLMAWDDSEVSDSYIVDNNTSSSLFALTGQAKIRHGVSAGYRVEMEWDGAESIVVSQTNNDGGGPNNSLDLRHSYWWISSQRLGKISVGQTSFASWLTNAMDTSGTKLAAGRNKRFIGGSLQFRTNAGALGGANAAILAVTSPYDLVFGDMIKYDSPKIRGFKLSASLGEDDAKDIALRYSGTHGDFLTLFGISYIDTTDTGADIEAVTGSLSIFHKPTGINISAAAGDRNTEGSTLDQNYYYLKAGLRRKINTLGETAISADYINQNEHAAAGGRFQQWGVQLLQKVDAANMELYSGWSNSSYTTTAMNYQDINIFISGARIRF